MFVPDPNFFGGELRVATQDRQHRCNDTLALHVVDIMTSALRSGETGQAVELKTTCERPAALDSASARLLLV